MTTDNLTPEEIREGNRIVAEYMRQNNVEERDMEILNPCLDELKRKRQR